VADLLKHAASHVCYHTEFGRSALKGVGINTAEPRKLGAQELHCLGMGAVADPNIHAPPTHVLWYHVKFGSSETNGVRINRKEPPKFGSSGTHPFGMGRC